MTKLLEKLKALILGKKPLLKKPNRLVGSLVKNMGNGQDMVITSAQLKELRDNLDEVVKNMNNFDEVLVPLSKVSRILNNVENN